MVFWPSQYCDCDDFVVIGLCASSSLVLLSRAIFACASATVVIGLYRNALLISVIVLAVVVKILAFVW